jgi:hypothetical protein
VQPLLIATLIPLLWRGHKFFLNYNSSTLNRKGHGAVELSRALVSLRIEPITRLQNSDREGARSTKNREDLSASTTCLTPQVRPGARLPGQAGGVPASGEPVWPAISLAEGARNRSHRNHIGWTRSAGQSYQRVCREKGNTFLSSINRRREGR